MARYATGALTTAGSATLPQISLYSIASVSPVVREVGLTNVSSVATAEKLTYVTTAGTQGTGLTETKYRDGAAAASATGFNTHSVAPTLGGDLGYRASLGAAVGAGVIWTFGDQGITPPVGTANGVAVIVENGTGQALQAYVVRDE
jgi:hypothetical protein